MEDPLSVWKIMGKTANGCSPKLGLFNRTIFIPAETGATVPLKCFFANNERGELDTTSPRVYPVGNDL
jgi:hypothetical protein